MTQQQRQFTITMKMQDKTRRLWSGSRNLVLNGETYEGTFVKNADGTEGSAIMITAPQYVAGEAGNRCRFTVSVADETLRRRYSIDQGPIDCEIQWIYNKQASGSIGPLVTNYDYSFNTSRTVAQIEMENNIYTDIDIRASNTNGFWSYHSGGTSVSSATGPTSDNTDAFIYFETTNQNHTNSAAISNIIFDGGLTPNLQVQNWRSQGQNRILEIECCLQGSAFNTQDNGLFVWGTENNPNFSTEQTPLGYGNNELIIRNNIIGSVTGWEYDDTRDRAGQNRTDFAGVPFTISSDGGWRLVRFNIPDNIRYIGIAADVERTPSTTQNPWQSDVAIHSIKMTSQENTYIPASWEVVDTFDGRMSSPDIDIPNKTFSADIEDQAGRLGDGRVRNWTNEEQQRLNPGDRCFENLVSIENNELRLYWE